jgi:threonine-phosphate decarboxylase
MSEWLITTHGTHGGNRSELLKAAQLLGWQGNDTEFIDASVNLNPLGPPFCLKEVFSSVYEKIVVYPDPNYNELSSLAVQYHRLGKDFHVVFSNGADEILFALARMLKRIGIQNGLLRIPCYASYFEALRLADLEVRTVRNWDQYTPADIGSVWIGAPNNPDGIIPIGYPDSIVSLAKNNKEVLFIVDEAFIDFTYYSSLLECSPLPDNIIVIRSLTKIFTVPGLRIGYVVLSKQLASKLRIELQNWPLNAVAETFAIRVFQDPAIPCFIASTKRFMYEARNRIISDLSSCYELSKSEANFVLLRPLNSNKQQGLQLRNFCLAHGIALRNCDNFLGLDATWSRVAVRNPKEMEQIIKRLRDFIDFTKQKGC